MLDLLSKISGALGTYVNTYWDANRNTDDAWPDAWFLRRINAHFADSLCSDDDVIPLADLELEVPATATALPATLLTIQPHYFRGFLSCTSPIRLDGKLVVVEGRNSSGKTSLGESLEWLLTGALSRREGRDHGSPRELENCIANQFRPEGESTWVSGLFQVATEDDYESVTIRRELIRDYGATDNSTCESKLFINARELSSKEEEIELDGLFGSVGPILMQHTLRHFVDSSPDRRRQYFERLLRLNELTELIAISVVTDARLSDFASPNGTASLDAWRSLGRLADGRAIENSLRRSASRTKKDIEQTVMAALTEAAKASFSDYIDASDAYGVIRSRVDEKQRHERQRSFRPLNTFRPRVQLSDEAPPPEYVVQTKQAIDELEAAWIEYAHARSAMAVGNVNRAAIVSAFDQLLDANIIDVSASEQPCPLCNYAHTDSLTSERIHEIVSWKPLFKKEAAAQKALDLAASKLATALRAPIDDYNSLLPPLPQAAILNSHLETATAELVDAVQNISTTRQAASVAFDEHIQFLSHLTANPLRSIANDRQLSDMTKRCLSTVNVLCGLHGHARAYATAFQHVEQAVGEAARQDPGYRLREAWLTCADDMETIVADIKWEDAKLRAQRDLKSLRDCLLESRRQFLESRRSAFNKGIQTVWSKLRGDTYSRFSELSIPKTGRRRLPVEIEVKALLDDGTSTRNVDALQVFSESQVNALGIAAFITRSELIGHRVIVFDDPVQSMDEEHFKTFARDVLQHLLAEEFQVVLLTHNDTFARDVSYWHYDRPEYVTMSVRHTRRQGCVVEEGNRLVPERLKHAEKFLNNGRLDEAWQRIRLAIERLYLVSYDKYGGDDFNPASWADQTAGYMWDHGAGDVILARVPDAELHLKEIVKLTVGGTHDVAARGETDLRNAIGYLRSMLGKLRIGG